MFALFAILAVMASCGSGKSTDEVESTETEVVAPAEGEVAPAEVAPAEGEVAPGGAEGEAKEEVAVPAVK